MPKSERVSDAELEERIAWIRDHIDRGFNGAEIWRLVQAECDWGIGRAQCYNYITRAYEDMADEAAKVNRAAYFTRSLARFDYIYQKAIANNDLVNARKATENVVSLLRLDTPNADFDWQKEAIDKGLNPVEIMERMKRLMASDDSDESKVANGHR